MKVRQNKGTDIVRRAVWRGQTAAAGGEEETGLHVMTNRSLAVRLHTAGYQSSEACSRAAPGRACVGLAAGLRMRRGWSALES